MRSVLALVWCAWCVIRVSGVPERVVVKHPHEGSAHSDLSAAADAFNRDNPDVLVVVEESGWDALYTQLLKNSSCHQDPDCEVAPHDVGVVTIGNTWAGNLYDRGVLSSLQTYFDGWRTRSSRGDVTRDFVSNVDFDYMFPRSKMGPGAAVNEWYALPMDVGTRILFWRKDLYAEYLNRTEAPDTLEDLFEMSLEIIQRMEADERVDVWGVSNQHNIVSSPTVTGVNLYAQFNCTQPINVQQVLCGESMEPCSLPATPTCTPPPNTTVGCAAGTALLAFRLPSPAIVRCVELSYANENETLGNSNWKRSLNIPAATVVEGESGRADVPEAGLQVSGVCCGAGEVSVVAVEAGSKAAAAGLFPGMTLEVAANETADLMSRIRSGTPFRARLTGGLVISRYRSILPRVGWKTVDWERGASKVTNQETWGFPIVGGGGSSQVLQSFLTFAFGYGSSFVGPGHSSPYHTDDFRAGLKKYTDMYLERETNRLNPFEAAEEFGSPSSVAELFARGKAVNAMGASWIYGSLHTAGWGSGRLDEATQLGVGKAPAGPRGRFAFLGGSGWAIPSYVNQTKKDSAWRFLEFAFDPSRPWLQRIIFGATLIPAYYSVLLQSQQTGDCAAVCKQIIDGLAFAVPLHFPYRGFYKMARLEENKTVEWMVQAIHRGADLNETTDIGSAWFDAVTADPPEPELPTSEGIAVWVIGMIAGIAGGILLIAAGPVLWQLTAKQRQIARLYNNAVVAERCAVAIAAMQLDDQEEYLKGIPDPNKIQTAFIAIVAALQQYRSFLPQAILEQDSSHEESTDGNVLEAVTRASSESKPSTQESGTVNPLVTRPHRDSCSQSSGCKTPVGPSRMSSPQSPRSRGAPASLQLGMSQRTCTLLALDSCLSAVDGMDEPQADTASILFEVLCDETKCSDGVVISFGVGGVFSAWNSHRGNTRHAMCAVHCGLTSLGELLPSVSSISWAIGITTGRCLSGVFGGDVRRATTVCGPPVGLAKSLAVLGRRISSRLLVTEPTYDRAGHTKLCRMVDVVPECVETEDVASRISHANWTVYELGAPVTPEMVADSNRAFLEIRQGNLPHAAQLLREYLQNHGPDRQVKRLLEMCALSDEEVVPYPYVRSMVGWASCGESRNQSWLLESPDAVEHAAAIGIVRRSSSQRLKLALEQTLTPAALHGEIAAAVLRQKGPSLLQIIAGGGMPKTLVTSRGDRWLLSSKVLGEGAFGKVYLGLSAEGGLVAIKSLKLSPSSVSSPAATSHAERRRRALERRKQQQQTKGAADIPREDSTCSAVSTANSGASLPHEFQELLHEVGLLSRLRGEHVVAYFGSVVDGGHVWIAMEYMPGGSLHGVVSQFGPLPVVTIRRYTKDILRGLTFLHENSIVHRDMKPHNCLLQIDGQCKLADFGAAASLSGMSGRSEVIGTPLFMAPEACLGYAQAASDVWAVGIIVCFLLTGQLPYESTEDGNPHQIMFRISKGHMRPVIRDDISAVLRDFCSLCLQHEPTHRPQAATLLMHPALHSVDAE